MKRFFLLGLAALGLVALAPTGSKADEGFHVYIGPPDQRPYYYHHRYYHHRDAYRWHRWHRRYYDPDTGRYYYWD